MTDKITLPLVIIQWNDHNSDDDWQGQKTAKEGAKPALISTVGWLIHETDDIYQVASNYAHEDGDVSMIMNIVKTAVVKTINVPEPKKRRRK